jgi:organic radical activating enzyme
MILAKKLSVYGLEYRLSSHCNLSCKGCSAASPYAPRQLSSTDDFKASLEKLEPYLVADRITLLGGEPLLNPQLVDFLRIAKKSGISRQVVLTTNALLLDKCSQEIWSLLDGVEISLYPKNFDQVKNKIGDFIESANKNSTFLSIYPKSTFDHILFSSPLPESQVGLVFKECQYKHSTHTISNQKLYRCSISSSIHYYLNNFLEQSELNAFRDYVRLDNSKNLKQDIVSLLTREQHLSSCRYCAGSSGCSFQSEQLKRGEIESNPYTNAKVFL